MSSSRTALPHGDDRASHLALERLRRRFRPARVHVLFVGESPPASGRFFYRRDSGLYRAVLEAFQMADPSIDDASFLTEFRAHGCYLVDLCREPVDRLDGRTRRKVCRDSEVSLSRTIARLKPALIVTFARSIEGNVARATARARWRGRVVGFPYPGRWSRFRLAFLDGLAPTIERLMRRRGRRMKPVQKRGLSRA